MRSGCSAPFGFSKSNAGPPALTVRSTISVISRSGSTSAETRTSSPSRSSSAIQSRRSFSTTRVYGGCLAVSRCGIGLGGARRSPMSTPSVVREAPRPATSRLARRRSRWARGSNPRNWSPALGTACHVRPASCVTYSLGARPRSGDGSRDVEATRVLLASRIHPPRCHAQRPMDAGVLAHVNRQPSQIPLTEPEHDA